jgi:acyl-coenzyme A thioesterase PaaI-like protein
MDATALARRLLEPVPAHRAIGVHVLRAVDGTAAVTLTASDLPTNHVGAPHAGSLLALLDATCLAAVLAACPSEPDAVRLVPLEVSATLDFRGRAQGRLVGECTMDDAGRAALRCLLAEESDRARVGTLTEISDSTGRVVCSGTLRWNVRLLPAASSAPYETRT